MRKMVAGKRRAQVGTAVPREHSCTGRCGQIVKPLREARPEPTTDAYCLTEVEVPQVSDST